LARIIDFLQQKMPGLPDIHLPRAPGPIENKQLRTDGYAYAQTGIAKPLEEFVHHRGHLRRQLLQQTWIANVADLLRILFALQVPNDHSLGVERCQYGDGTIGILHQRLAKSFGAAGPPGIKNPVIKPTSRIGFGFVGVVGEEERSNRSSVGPVETGPRGPNSPYRREDSEKQNNSRKPLKKTRLFPHEPSIVPIGMAVLVEGKACGKIDKLIAMIDFDPRYYLRKCLSLLLVMLLAQWQLQAQDPNKPGPAVSGGLRIYVLEGSDAVNFIPEGRGTTPVVEVRDENQLPVSGATVEFHLPETGPGGEFPNGQHTFTAITNTAGQAAGPFTVGPKPGKFRIQINAKLASRSGAVVILQSNTLKIAETTRTTGKKRAWYNHWYIWAIAGGGVALIVVLAVTSGGGSKTGPAVALTPGIPTFGAPH
jgi:hypothetical protein